MVMLDAGYRKSHAKLTAESIKMPFLRALSPKNHLLDRGTYGRHLANTVEQSETVSSLAVTTSTVTV